MGPLGRPIGIWIAMVYLAVLALGASNPWSPLWSGSPFIVLSLAAMLLSMALLWSLSRWVVAATAVVAALQSAFFLIALLDPSWIVVLLGYRSPYHDTYVVVSHGGVAQLVHLAALAAIPLYSAWLWRRGALR
ncbi:MAG TPA: hypothetical protein VFZ16_02390 [Hyphomicrobiaceae bacterium]|nr:hypothetical protein [Hyphomicrobiaceae bacterium]